MNIVHYEPGRVINTALERLAEDLMGMFPQAQAPGRFVPSVDISEIGDSLILQLEVPGIEKDAIKVEVHQGVLTVSGEKKVERQSQGKGVYRSERVFGAFKRTFTLPDEVNPEQVTAKQENGVLTITLHKRPETKPRQVTISYKD